jgi:protein-disulfide isomerase
LDLDLESFQECIDSERYADEVTADARFAASLGVSGTPMFFVNGIPLVGAQPLANFEIIIEQELDK